MNLVTTPARDGFTERYEQLRKRAVEGAGSGSQVGMAVLRREGVSAWMSRVVADKPIARPAATRGTTQSQIGELDLGMVRVLANMTLGSLGAAHA